MLELLLNVRHIIKTLIKKTGILNQTFIILLIISLIATNNLLLYQRVEKFPTQESYINWFVQLALYAGIIWQIYQKRNELMIVNRFPVNFLGSFLIIFPYINANFIVAEISISWYILPLIIFIGFALLTSGFRGIKQFQRELTILTIFPLILILLRLLMRLLRSTPITVISAKFTSLILWYIGFDSVTQGTLVSVNNGVIDVYWPCTALPLLSLLLKFSILLIFFFPSLFKNPYLPFLLSIVISFVFSIIRLVIMALVVTDKAAFHYWHGVQGGDLFSFLALFSFGAVVLFISPNPIPLSLSVQVLPKKSRPVSWLMIFTVISLVIILCHFLLNPSAGLTRFGNYRFPPQLPLANWQFIESKSIPRPYQQFLKKEDIPVQPDNGEEALNHVWEKDILSGQIYHYQRAGQSLIVSFYYIPYSSGDVESYHDQFRAWFNLPNSIKLTEKQNSNGHHLQLSDPPQYELTACINSHGKSTATIPQFIAYFYRPYLNPSQWFNLLNGKQTLRDRRCLWGQLSLTGAKASETELKTVWQELLAYWQTNFPPLKP